MFNQSNVLDYATSQTSYGINTTLGYDANFINQLETEIVPNAVQTLLNSYPSLGYLTDSSIGIGLNLYNDCASTTLASVKGNLYGPINNLNISYTLNLNMAAVDWNATTNTIENRSKLESVIAHEMTHALMDEALTSGMFGVGPLGGNSSLKFPS